METSNKNNRSFILGSVKAITNCLDIVLYNKSNIDRKISLYNLDEFYKSYLSGIDTSIHIRLGRTSTNFDFIYRSGSLEDGFNVIVYISPSSNMPLGYTEFINAQGFSGDLSIGISIQRHLETIRVLDDPNFSIEVNIKNDISGNKLSKNYVGKELFNYVTTLEITQDSYYNLYTNNTGRIESDPRSIIYSPTSGIISKNYFWKFKINKDINIDPHSNEYDKFKVCYFKNDLVIACWKNGSASYSMYSLINKNSLGYPFVIHGEVPESEISEILGKFYKDSNGSLRYLDTGTEVEKVDGENLVYDHQDNRGILYSLPGFFSKSELIKYIPDINNIYLDLDYYLRSNQLIVYDKIGSWFILTQRYGGNTLYIAVSPVSLLYMSSEDLERACFVNDQTVILKESDYYVIYKSAGTKLYTERARAIINSKGTFELYEIDEGMGIYLCILGTEDDERHYLEYYDSGLVEIVFKYEDLHSTILNRYRRNYYPSLSGIPEIIDSFKGLIFYKQDNIITYL